MAIFVVVKVSISRGIEDIVGSFYMYFVCEIPVCNEFLISNIYTKHTMGYFSFNGFIYPIVALLRVIGHVPSEMYSYAQTIRNFIESNWIFIPDYGHNINAFLPAGAFLYIDGGFIFEFIVMFLSGFITQACYEKMNYEKNQKNIGVYLMVVIAILLSFYRYYLTSYQYVIALIYVLLLYKKSE